ncbi:uncharacterized protein B0I36DRAFT_366171 [Microdochium trichocladiopsis]|uniref:Uncharacterized protein n=1 Tax=Microdochium trichocladiopsis TaxID=1682393 RepID=A0A9P8Y178_9PEZI|nr:uncharacterized protein B0I36DRAFT_366171 [Microdochium trichocladiopsis]KAH7026630.1 hypothetical protein B0I36DRAFT_366171 [Microdochium trichocladiopsis]
MPGKDCEGYMGFRDKVLSLDDSEKFNRSRMYEAAFLGSPGGSDGTSYYDRYGAGTFPVIIVWGHSDTATEQQQLPDDHVTFACVKVDTVAPGVPMPKASVSAGRRLGFDGGSVGFLAGVVTAGVLGATTLLF